MSPTVSVVTVTLNAAHCLPRLIESLRKQTDKDFEFVIIDGASKDGTWDIIQASSDVVTYSVHERDRGFYDALNKAIHALKTDYYVVMGADDTFHADAIANFKSVVRDTNADVVVADVKAGDRILRGYKPHRAWRGHHRMVTSHSVGMLFRSALHKRFGEYSFRYPICADGHFIKLVCTAQTVKTVAGNFVAGEFALGGFSNQNAVRTLCEIWQIQLDTGENPLVQYLLFQKRLIRRLPRILKRKRPTQTNLAPATEASVTGAR